MATEKKLVLLTVLINYNIQNKTCILLIFILRFMEKIKIK